MISLCLKAMAAGLRSTMGSNLPKGMPLSWYELTIKRCFDIGHLTPTLLRHLEDEDSDRICVATDVYWHRFADKDFPVPGTLRAAPMVPGMGTWRDQYAEWAALRQKDVKSAGKKLRKAYRSERKAKKQRRMRRVEVALD